MAECEDDANGSDGSQNAGQSRGHGTAGVEAFERSTERDERNQHANQEVREPNA